MDDLQRPMTTSLTQRSQSETNTTESRGKQISGILARLALHYWRPDFTPQQARLILEDYVHDLEGYSPDQVNTACREYRCDPNNKFYPRSGEIIGLIRGNQPAVEFRSRLPKMERGKYLEENTTGPRSVADVLRKHGKESAANAWAEKSNKPT